MSDFLSVKELSQKLNVSDQTIYNLIEKGLIKAIRIGDILRISNEEYLRFIKDNSNKEG